MITSRALLLGKAIKHSLTKQNCGNTSQVRNSSGLFSYRTGPYPPGKFQKYGGEIMMALMWWWILWHLWTEPDHILGEAPIPDPKKWTNEELGIPPDDE